MNTTNNTILITGGGSGIGYEIARLFASKGNKIIITGRNADKLSKAAATLPNTTAIVADVNDAAAVQRLADQVSKDFPDLNVLINNAGTAYAYQLSDTADAYSKASEEITTNYLSTVRLTEKFLALLGRQPQAAIVNVSSIVSFAPALRLPTYSASKAALHSYTKTLRLALEQSGSNISVYEVKPPLVDTEFAKELTGDKIKPEEVATALYEGMVNNTFEVHVASTAKLYDLFLSSPDAAHRHLNGIK